MFHISGVTLAALVKQYDKDHRGYDETDVEQLSIILADKPKEYLVGFDYAGQNEYYAKILKDGEIFSSGIYSSTNLNDDRRRFIKVGLELIIIDEIEAKRLYRELYLDIR
ncbi:MAG: hypothetical protein ACP5N7_02040 [Candidatus Pacearchaeota archaeon]